MASRITGGRGTGAVFATVAALIFSAGWAANHYASVITALRDGLGLSPVLLNGAFAIYAVGLVPCLLAGGILADRIGARPAVLAGGAIAAAGNLLILLWSTTAGLLTGRFIVGLGVGLMISAGTAWAGRLRGTAGVTMAGIVLTAGFAVGAIASGGIVHALPTHSAVTAAFLTSVVLSVLAVAASAIVGDAPTPPAPAPARADGDSGASQSNPANPNRRSMGRALATALPMSLWVFSCVTTSFLVLAARVSERVDSGALLPGIAAALAFGAGVVAQSLGRTLHWGPRSGIAGALLAAAGMTMAGLGGTVPPVWLFIVASVVLGTAYGLCLREGLLDIDAFSPPHRRGTAIGVYYVFTYLGAGTAVLLEWLLPIAGPTLPLLVICAIALAAAAVRTGQVRAGVFAGR
ncbi:MFS transporter [Corynebacterium sp. NPDC060344]|uniref:MFS transporter n=1 Tax=Corynebacterium sp. NPDC060344 TaxID=3347101 RepID=UPI00365584F4